MNIFEFIIVCISVFRVNFGRREHANSKPHFCLITVFSKFVDDSFDDSMYCFGRFEAYNFWNKSTQRYQPTASTRHYHLNPVCTKVWQSESPLRISAGNVQISQHLRAIVKERFS